MLWLPAARLAVLQVALFELALPVGRATAPQPLSVVPSAVKPTLPVGALPVTVAVNVTLPPTVDGLAELVSVVVVAVRLLDVSVTASMKVVLSPAAVPVKVRVCVPVVAIDNGMLKLLKLVLAGVTGLPIGLPSTLTWMGCWKGETQHERCAASNARVWLPALRVSCWLMLPVLWMNAVWAPLGAAAA